MEAEEKFPSSLSSLNSEDESFSPLSSPRPPRPPRLRPLSTADLQKDFYSWVELRARGNLGGEGGEELWTEMEQEEEEWRRILAEDQRESEGEREDEISFSEDEEAEEEEEMSILSGAQLHIPQNLPIPLTNLEVMGDFQIGALLLGLYFGVIIATLLSIVYVLVAYNVYFKEITQMNPDDNFILLRLDVYLLALLNFIFLIVLLIYMGWIRLYCCCFECCFKRIRFRRTKEQKYLVVCLFGLFFAFNPIGSITSAYHVWFGTPPEQGFMSNLSNIAYQIATQFFILKMIKHFGYNHANGRSPHKRQIRCIPFDILDICVILIPCFYKLILGDLFDLAFDSSPIGNFISMLMITGVAFNHNEVPGWNFYLVILGSVVLDCFSLGYTIMEGQRAHTRLGEVPYALNRRKQLGFRFFVSHTVTCWAAYSFLNFFLVATTPPKRYYADYSHWLGLDLDSNGDADIASDGSSSLLLGTTYAYSILALIILVWAIEIVFVNKPLARDYKLWEAAAYTSTEKQNEMVFERKISTHFCLETCINLLNFAKLVYTKVGSPQDFNEIVDGATKPNEVVGYFKREETDTHCLITSGPDRIIVAFRGTKTITNFITDVNFLQTPVTRLMQPPNITLDTKSDGLLEELDVLMHEHEVFSNEEFQGAGVHAGFLSAYLSIRDSIVGKLALLLAEGNRPVVVTGHSLGGALGMLFAYDLMLHKKILWRSKKVLKSPQVQVMTFGSPRVGNPPFSRHFNSLVGSCFRVVCSRDTITHIPFTSWFRNTGFHHCGVVVLLDEKGNMLVNPSVVEKSWWHLTFFQSKVTRHLLPCYIRFLNRIVLRCHHDEIEFTIWKKNITAKNIPMQETAPNKEKGCSFPLLFCCGGATEIDEV